MTASARAATHGSSRAARALSSLDAPAKPSRVVPWLAGFGTVGVHALVVAFAASASNAPEAKVQKPVAVTEMVEVELPKAEPEPEPEPEPEAEPEPPPPPKPVPAPPRPIAPAPPKPTAAAPPPAAAQAGQVLAATDDVVDFGETIVSGNGPKYAGGVTESGGTATHAVRDTRARAGGVEGGTGTDLHGDRSRAPQLAGAGRWDCPFPPEADDAGIDQAVVTLRVQIDANGGVAEVRATTDPGYGFGREARRCAQRKRWAPGLNRAGLPIAAATLINVRFER